MIYQVTPGLKKQIYDDGCYFMDLIEHAARLQAKTFSVDIDKINYYIYKEVVDRGWMRKDCYIIHPDKILSFLGLRVAYLGKKNADYVCQHNEIETNLWHYAPEDWYHFVNGDGHGITTYDPWGVSTTATQGELVSKRVFEVLT